eukprot:4466856-Pyramimonas_sp.AAC.1
MVAQAGVWGCRHSWSPWLRTLEALGVPSVIAVSSSRSVRLNSVWSNGVTVSIGAAASRNSTLNAFANVAGAPTPREPTVAAASPPSSRFVPCQW